MQEKNSERAIAKKKNRKKSKILADAHAQIKILHTFVTYLPAFYLFSQKRVFSAELRAI